MYPCKFILFRIVEQILKSYRKHFKQVEKIEIKEVEPEVNTLYVKKLKREVRGTFEMLDEILVSFDMQKGKESIVLRQFQNVMAPLILRILDKFHEYSETVKMLRKRNQSNLELEKDLLSDPIFSDFKKVYKNYSEKIIDPARKSSSSVQIVSKALA